MKTLALIGFLISLHCLGAEPYKYAGTITINNDTDTKIKYVVITTQKKDNVGAGTTNIEGDIGHSGFLEAKQEIEITSNMEFCEDPEAILVDDYVVDNELLIDFYDYDPPKHRMGVSWELRGIISNGELESYGTNRMWHVPVRKPSPFEVVFKLVIDTEQNHYDVQYDILTKSTAHNSLAL
jgi:hypothetical protein